MKSKTYKVVHEFDLNGRENSPIDEEAAILRLTAGDNEYARNDFVTIRSLKTGKRIYKIVKGATNQQVDKNMVFVSYRSFKQLGISSNDPVTISPSTFWQKYILFYFNSPNPLVRRRIIVESAVFITSLVLTLESLFDLGNRVFNL